MEIYLNDLLGFALAELNSGIVKVRFSQGNGGEEAVEVYKRDSEMINTRWLLWRNKRRFFKVGDIVLSLLRVREEWLLTAVKKITKVLDQMNGIGYEAKSYARCSKYADGRVFVRYHKKCPASCRMFADICKEMVVCRVEGQPYRGEGFPGYDNVRLTYRQLESIVKAQTPDWIYALSRQKAVYVITDCASGKLYVGSATDKKGMLLNRWEAYVKTGHGGDVELKKLDFQYIKDNFQYSILENYNSKVDDQFVLDRESFWKKVFVSRDHGYNRN